MPDFDDSIIEEDSFWGGNEGSSWLQAKFCRSKDDLGDSYENCYLHQDYWYNDPEIDFNGFHSEPLGDAQFQMVYHGCPNHAGSALKFYQPCDQTNSEDNYDRISQVWSTSVTNLGKLPNDFDNDSAEGKCIGKGCYSEHTLHEAKNFGSYLGRSKNSNLMEKVEAHNSENNVDHFCSGHNAPGNHFEAFPCCIDTCVDDLAPSFCQSERQKQPVQNTSMAAETEENYWYPNYWSYGEQLKVELQQDISSLTAYVGRLENQVEHLTHQVQDMASKLSGENKLTAPILNNYGESKAVLEEPEIISSADETTQSKFFIETEDSIQKLDETWWTDDDSSSSSAYDWEMI